MNTKTSSIEPIDVQCINPINHSNNGSQLIISAKISLFRLLSWKTAATTTNKRYLQHNYYNTHNNDNNYCFFVILSLAAANQMLRSWNCFEKNALLSFISNDCYFRSIIYVKNVLFLQLFSHRLKLFIKHCEKCLKQNYEAFFRKKFNKIEKKKKHMKQ